MPVKVLDEEGSGYTSWMVEGIYYAVDHGADIISYSAGGSDSSTKQEAVEYAYTHGVTFIAAAGNEYEEGNLPAYPAAYDDYAIAVGATRYDETRSYYSNTGSYLDLVAPGGDITVDQNGDGYADGVLQQTFSGGDPCNFAYHFWPGTSMATPHVSGVAALLIANGVTGPDNVRNALESTAEDKGTPGWDEEYGWGIVDAYAALQGEENQAQTLSSGYVSPTTGDMDTYFYYYVTYTDSDGDAPTYSYVYIDESPHTMTKISGDYSTGATYRYYTTLSEGSHNYYFYFSDGEGHYVYLPSYGWRYSGPTVSGTTEESVTFDVPPEAVIGEDVDIKGSISAGDAVDIIIKGEECIANDLSVDENNEFNVVWDTDGYMVGSYTIEGYIDSALGAGGVSDYDGVYPTGNTTIQLIAPSLSATQPRNVVAEGDDYTLEGTATGVGDVDYMLIGPKGWKSGYATASVLAGFFSGAASVIDDGFSEDVTMTEGLDTGVWITQVLSPGRDGEYANGDTAGNLDVGDLSGKNQEQILEIVQELTVDVAGSDDLMVMLSFTVTGTNQPPTLASGNVTPSAGDTTTTFEYCVTYADPDGDAPTTKYIYVDGSPYTMTKISGDYTFGATFKYEKTLSTGSHNYYFYFDDGEGHYVYLPSSGTYSGPTVSAEEVLATIAVSPSAASLTVGGTQTFTATAYDQNDNPMAGVLITWGSTNTSVGTVSPATATTGTLGTATTTFTGVAAGTATVVASSGTVSDTASVTVTTDWNPWDDDDIITTEEIQDAVTCWLTDTPKNGHIITTAEIQELVNMWLTS